MLIIATFLEFVTAYDLSEYPSPFIKDGRFNGVLVVGDHAPADDVIALSNIIASLQSLVLDKAAKDNVAVDSLYKDQTKTYSFGNIYYEVTLNFVNAETAQFVVNGMTTKTLLPGEFERLPDGKILTLAGIKSDNGLYAVLSFSDKELDAKDILIDVGTAKLASEVDDVKMVNSILVGHACDNSLVAEVSGRINCKESYSKNVGTIEAYEMPNGKIALVVTGYSTKDTLNAANVLAYFKDYKNSLKGHKIEVKKGQQSTPVPMNKMSQDNKIDKNFSLDYSKISIMFFLILVVTLIILIFYSGKSSKK